MAPRDLVRTRSYYPELESAWGVPRMPTQGERGRWLEDTSCVCVFACTTACARARARAACQGSVDSGEESGMPQPQVAAQARMSSVWGVDVCKGFKAGRSLLERM